MDHEKGSDYSCQECGSEAEVVIEEPATGKDATRVGAVVCEHCGSKEEIVLAEGGEETTRAVNLAIQREKEAYLFYRKAQERTGSERGRDMFAQLADFELNHYRKIIHLSHSLRRRGQWVPYSGQEELKPNRRIEELEHQRDTMKDDIEALTMAIKKEEEAEAFYREMAEKAGDPAGKEMFRRLAGEEEIHRKILDDQLYSLSNRGLWLWGD